jgi:hypothetical protein
LQIDVLEDMTKMIGGVVAMRTRLLRLYYFNVSTVSRINFGSCFRPMINCMFVATGIDYVQTLHRPIVQSTNVSLSMQLDRGHAIFQSEVAFTEGAVNNMVL